MVTFARAVLVALSSSVTAQMTLRRALPPPIVEDAKDSYLLADSGEDDLCMGNEVYCTEGTEYYVWVSANCPKHCAVFQDEQHRGTGDLRPDCKDFTNHCVKDNDDGKWARLYCAKTCEKHVERLNRRPSAMSKMASDNPLPVMALTLAALLAYIKKLQNTHKVHQCWFLGNERRAPMQRAKPAICARKHLDPA